MPSRILLLGFFYPPDLSAGAFRAAALVEALRLRGGEDIHVDVLTTEPNRYSSHAVEAVSVEQSPSVYVRRIHLPQMREGFVGQALSFWRYARRVSRLVSSEEYDLVVATSSRLMTAVLGAWVAYRRKARLYLDIRDIFVENLRVLFPSPVAAPLGWFFGALERWAIKRADRVNLVSRGFLGYFQPRYPGLTYSHFSNGVDEAFIDCALVAVPEHATRQPLQVLYAGNVGDGQGLHLILPELAERLQERVYFRVVGAGGRLEALREAITLRALSNIELLPPVAREQLLQLYQEADVLFLHLNDFAAFRRVLPSKLFEYAATGKPMWAGVAGYAADFIGREVRNVALFSPCKVGAAIEALDGLDIVLTNRSAFVRGYARERIMNEMAQDILQLLEPC